MAIIISMGRCSRQIELPHRRRPLPPDRHLLNISWDDDSSWQLFWQDDDSSIGGPNNSSVTIGPVIIPDSTPFSLVFDLTDGGTSTTGATGWGPGQLDRFRIDPFQGTSNAGQSFTIGAITFGDALTPVPVPEPSSIILLGVAALGIMAFARRLR